MNNMANTRFINGPHTEEIISSQQESEDVFPIEAEIPKGRISTDKTDALKNIYEIIWPASCNKALTKEQNNNCV